MGVDNGNPVSMERFKDNKRKAFNGRCLVVVAADGGDVEIIDIKENLIYVDLTGACATCPGASGTIQHVIEKKLRDKVDDALRVIQI